MSLEWIIIDGYSLLYRARERGVAAAPTPMERAALIARLERLCGSLAVRITIVFDGRGKGGADELYTGPIEVLFSPAAMTADSVIERLVHESSDVASITVVTSDRRERETVEAAGARSLSCGDFILLCEREENRRAVASAAAARCARRATLGDRFPPA